jgi:ATP-dependent phosphoenolpyruvate carboxykinase
MAETTNSHLKPTPPDIVHDLFHIDLSQYGITLPPKKVLRNPPVPVIYENALRYEPDATEMTINGALVAWSGAKTGRSPKDKRIVEDELTKDIWWGPVNIKLEELSFLINRSRAIDWLNTRPLLYCIDAYASWDPKYRIKIRVICSRAYHALFMWNMLIRPSRQELKDFGKPDWVIFNSGEFPANVLTKGMSSKASVCIDFKRAEFVILGTQYAGEMKKGVFTIMNYLMPKLGQLSLHSSANEGPDGQVTLFFGLSGTGKTTLSTDPHRRLIGDDEHVWSDDGVFNIEGGCYAKCIKLDPKKEPEIYNAIRFGAILENVVLDHWTREVDFDSEAITENTRVSYPLEFIPGAKIPAIGNHPSHVIMLTCDAFGVLPPVAKLTPNQAMYHFISGYTAKVAGTEVGVTSPEATFSACFGAPFMVWHPTQYAQLLADRLRKHSCQAWLLNTGWVGGPPGVGSRIALKYSRAIIDAIHSGELSKVEYQNFPIFNLQVPKTCPGVPSEVLMPRNSWADKNAYDQQLEKVAKLFIENFKAFADKADKAVVEAGPKI